MSVTYLNSILTEDRDGKALGVHVSRLPSGEIDHIFFEVEGGKIHFVDFKTARSARTPNGEANTMPLIVAVVLYGGTFFGYAAGSTAAAEMRAGNQVQQHYLELKHNAIAKVAAETLAAR